jgi:hypothetical protein
LRGNIGHFWEGEFTDNTSKLLNNVYSLFGDSENRGKKYSKIRALLSIALFNILGTHYLIHI